MSDPRADPGLLTFLEGFLTPARREKIDRVLAARTGYVRVVVEDLFQPHNASAVMRTCECFGVQHMHIIENRYAFRPNSEVSMGAAKWVTTHRHRAPETDNTTACLEELKAAGYRTVATCLREDAVPLHEVPTDRPLALLFGTEEDGLSERAIAQADLATTIPMQGFTQSFNISVSAAICLSHLLTRIRAERDDWALPEAEKEALRAAWVRASLKHLNPEALERRFLEDRAATPDPTHPA
ncbi:MAG: TrmH family RNA methyltransferase [Opitutales bacterium]